MSPELWQRVKPLFHAASEMDASSRGPYLDRVCANDPELLREVERLLEQHDAASAVLDKSPLDLGLIDAPSSSVPALKVGELLAGRFEVLRFVQAGGMGEVYEATDLEFGGSVALKTLRPALVHDETSLGRFKREVQLAKRVGHRNLCRIFDGGWHRGGTREIAFLTMEFLHGKTLAAHLKDRNPFHAAEALPLLRQIAEGLAALHEAAIIHRDLKPGNVILVPANNAPPRAVITDFGLARLVDSGNQAEKVTKGAGFMLGTPEYMAPEQLAGERDSVLGPFSDIYSFGTVAYEMLCGRLPFDAAAVGMLIVQKLTKDPPALSELIPEISTGWEQFILHCLEREPGQRIQTAAELLQALDELEAGPQSPRPARKTNTAAPEKLSAGGNESLADLPEPERTATPKLAGEIISHYRILSKLGEGGMGVVYEAEDLKLKRKVAIKFLSLDTIGSGQKERFLREAQAIASLDHPNICTIHEVDEVGGRLFFAMALVAGETLARRIRKGPLPVDEALDLAIQAAEGLDAAHEKQIVHRDIKAANIMVTAKGRAIILDFGLARTGESSRLTQPGAILGTAVYLSPEQVQGAPVDNRSDLWSLGVVLYEMLTGGLPFDADYRLALLYSILNEDPAPVSSLRPDVPPGIDAVLKRLLAKRPEQRYQTARDLIEDLSALGATWLSTQTGVPVGIPAAGGAATIPAAAEAEIPSDLPLDRPPLPARRLPRWAAGLAAALMITSLAILQAPTIRTPVLRSLCVRFPGSAWFCELPADKDVALLPFNISGEDPESETLAAGMSGFLQDSFYRLAPNKESMCVHIRGGTRSLETYGAALALTGQFAVRDNQIRLIASLEELPKEPNGAKLLMRKVDITAPSGDSQAAAVRLLESLAAMLEVKFPREAFDGWRRELPRNTAAFTAYLQGRALLDAGRAKVGNEGEPDALRAAEQFNRAIGLDYAFALAHVGLGDSYRLLFERTSDQSWSTRSRNAYQEAQGLHPEFAAVHRGLGELEMSLGDNPAARQQFAEAVRIDPYDHDVQIKYATALEAAGLSDETESLWKRSIGLRPQCWYGYNEIARYYLDHGKKVEAAKAYQTIIRLAPDLATAHHNLAFVYLKVGRYDDAIERAAESIRLHYGTLGYSTLGRAYLYRHCNSDALLNLEYALRDAERSKKETGRDYPRILFLWYNLADGLETTGRLEEASRAYRNAVESARAFLAVEPNNRSARGYLALALAGLGLRDEALREIGTVLQLSPNNEESLFQAALVHESFAKRDSAIHYLELALANGLTIHEITQAHKLTALRADPRYQKLLARLGRDTAEEAGSTTLIRSSTGCPGWTTPGKGLRPT